MGCKDCISRQVGIASEFITGARPKSVRSKDVGAELFHFEISPLDLFNHMVDNS
jgi:hypothetical protein